MKNIEKDSASQKISRQVALKKAGKYAAFTAASAIILLAPKSVQAQASMGIGSGFGGGSYSPPGGEGGKQSPFTKADSPKDNSGLKQSPWK